MSVAWGLKSPALVRDIKKNKFLLKLDSLKTFEYVMKEGPWRYKGDALIVVSYDGVSKATDLVINSVALSVRIFDLPEFMMNEGQARQLGGKLGKVIEYGGVVRNFLRDEELASRGIRFGTDLHASLLKRAFGKRFATPVVEPFAARSLIFAEGQKEKARSTTSSTRLTYKGPGQAADPQADGTSGAAFGAPVDNNDSKEEEKHVPVPPPPPEVSTVLETGVQDMVVDAKDGENRGMSMNSAQDTRLDQVSFSGDYHLSGSSNSVGSNLPRSGSTRQQARIAIPLGMLAKNGMDINMAQELTGKAGLGVVMRDSQGTALLTSWRVLFDSTSAEEVEAMACREGLELAAEWENKKSIVKSDCLSVITMVNSKEDSRSVLWHIIRDIKEVGAKLPEVIFRAVKRERNRVAH
ncbi:hypothetical protein PR202_gb27354 [Eleusine coracana subsp. coracana]|uniref:RNase H type-1 domain-containing protein n=1 Tax=Eleusine coracana subsp. coracana TaxID=191504 RepID=A0AAV5FRL8_ELECO|nr:hypothetical protein PR202_gb27354 [Eleusine coracana subsp. coracana]